MNWVPDWLLKIFGHKIADKLGLQEGTMDETKKWYLSKGIWTGIVTALLGIYGTLSIQLHLPIIPEWIFAILGAMGIYTRATAKKKIE